MAAEGRLPDGVVAAAVAAELPGLRVRCAAAGGGEGRTPADLRRRLDELNRRMRGAQAVALRTRPVPQAYRAFYRQIGLDPDLDRTPAEEHAIARLVTGDACTGQHVPDALALAILETGVALVAFDEQRLDGPLTLRPAGPGDALPDGDYAHDLPAGRLVLADAAGPVAELFGRRSDHHAPRRATQRIRLVAIQVPGVPDMPVHEALWLAASALDPAGILGSDEEESPWS